MDQVLFTYFSLLVDKFTAVIGVRQSEQLDSRERVGWRKILQLLVVESLQILQVLQAFRGQHGIHIFP